MTYIPGCPPSWTVSPLLDATCQTFTHSPSHSIDLEGLLQQHHQLNHFQNQVNWGIWEHWHLWPRCQSDFWPPSLLWIHSRSCWRPVPQDQDPTSQPRNHPAVPRSRRPPQCCPHSKPGPERHEEPPYGSDAILQQSVHGVQKQRSCQCQIPCHVQVPSTVCEQVGEELPIKPYPFWSQLFPYK